MRFFLICFAILFGASAFAQKQNVYFLKNDGSEVPLRDSADFVRIVREPDSGSVLYNILEFYPKGARRMVGKSSKIDPVLSLEGTCITYYETGKKKQVATYIKNYKIGAEYCYFPNGKLYTVKEYGEVDSSNRNDITPSQKIMVTACNDSAGKNLAVDGSGRYQIYDDDFKRIEEEGDIKDGLRTGEWRGTIGKEKIKFTEQYEKGKLINGAALDEEGNYSYNTRFILPRYKTGIDAFYRYLSKFITYPILEREKGIQGEVLLTFTITKKGDVKDIKVVRSVSHNIDVEATRVLAKSKDWLPGIYFGRQTDAKFTVPIKFSLSQ